jgi:Ca2+-binding RTX toxin-like protein
MFTRTKFAKFLLIMIVIGLISMVIYLSSSAYSAANTVSGSKLGSSTKSSGVNETKPTECASLALTSIYYCSGSSNCTATNASELILGTANGETIRGQNGTDCIVGGAGDDTLRGGSGSDVCIGGPGNDTYINCSVTYP